MYFWRASTQLSGILRVLQFTTALAWTVVSREIARILLCLACWWRIGDSLGQPTVPGRSAPRYLHASRHLHLCDGVWILLPDESLDRLAFPSPVAPNVRRPHGAQLSCRHGIRGYRP